MTTTVGGTAMPGAALPGLDYIDADGHVLEHPDGFRDFAPKGFEDRVWHIEVDDEGREWAVMDGTRNLANFMSLAGTAGMSADDRDRAQRGELRYTEVRPAPGTPRHDSWTWTPTASTRRCSTPRSC